jgi:hypothetical protein
MESITAWCPPLNQRVTACVGAVFTRNGYEKTDVNFMNGNLSTLNAEEFDMSKRILMIAATGAFIAAGVAYAQFPIMDKVADTR